MSGNATRVREHMEVIGNDGQHVGTIDQVEGDRIKLTRKDDPDGSGQHHHYLPISSIEAVADNKVTLNLSAERARSLATMTGGSSSSTGMAASATDTALRRGDRLHNG